MAVLRRTPRTVYRVYSEEEYFAGADAPTDWQRSPARGALRERRLRRLAGAAALTGAMGTVAGVIAVAGVSTPSGARQIAADDVPRARLVHSPKGGARVARAVRWARDGQPWHARRVGAVGDRSAVRGHPVFANAVRRVLPRRAAATASTVPVHPSWRRPEVVDAAAQSTPSEATTTPATQVEFGFER